VREKVIDGNKHKFDGYPALLAAATTGLARRLSTGRCGQKLLPTVVAAEVERLSIAFSVECGCFVYGHSADRVLGHGF
jgi:hypothetical protein